MSEQDKSVKEYEREIKFHIPSEDDWDHAVKTMHLSKAGRASLLELLYEINADIENHNLYIRNHPSRDENISKLEDFEKAAKAFREVIVQNKNSLPSFLPGRALEGIGQIFTIDVINQVIGRNLSTRSPNRKMLKLLKEKNIKPKKLTKQENEKINQQIKSDAGYAYADKLLVHVLDLLIEPIDKWHEDRKRLSKGGRTKDQFRRDFVEKLAINADAIIGEKLSFDVKGNFFELADLTLGICGVSIKNLKNIIGEVVLDLGLSTKVKKSG